MPESDLLKKLLGSYCGETEQQLKRRLKGIEAPLLKRYLPQTWVFETESETVSFVVDEKGNATVHEGGGSNRDVTVKWKHEPLCAVLKARSPKGVQEGDRPTITYHTQKGRAAFNFLRKRIGI